MRFRRFLQFAQNPVRLGRALREKSKTLSPDRRFVFENGDQAFRPHEIGEFVNLTRFLEHFEVDCVIDVGANTGQYAQMLRTRIGFDGEIFSFEPNPRAFAQLSANSRTDPKWHAYDVALSDRTGYRDFNLVQSSQMGSLEAPTTEETRLLEDLNTRTGVVQVHTRTLDDVLPELRGVARFSKAFLKLDTQEHDLKVCDGVSDLSQFAGVQSEIAFTRLYEDAPLYHESIEYFRARGFEVCAIFPNNAGHFPRLLEQDVLMVRRTLLGHR